MFFFCFQLSIFASIILSLCILNASFTFTFTPTSLSNHSSTPLYISTYSPCYSYYNIILPLLLFSLFHLFLYHFHPCHPICFSAYPFSSLPLISSLTAANSFLSSPFFSLTASNTFFSTLISSLISLIMVFISLSISLL
jgi:hypothetical protein